MDDWTLSIESVKNTEERKHILGQEHQCGAGQKPSGVRMSILVGRKQRECLRVVIFVIIKSEPLLDGGAVFVPAGVVVKFI